MMKFTFVSIISLLKSIGLATKFVQFFLKKILQYDGNLIVANLICEFYFKSFLHVSMQKIPSMRPAPESLMVSFIFDGKFYFYFLSATFNRVGVYVNFDGKDTILTIQYWSRDNRTFPLSAIRSHWGSWRAILVSWLDGLPTAEGCRTRLDGRHLILLDFRIVLTRLPSIWSLPQHNCNYMNSFSRWCPGLKSSGFYCTSSAVQISFVNTSAL